MSGMESLGGVAHAQFGDDVLAVAVDRVLRDAEKVGYLLAGKPLADKAKDLLFAPRKREFAAVGSDNRTRRLMDDATLYVFPCRNRRRRIETHGEPHIAALVEAPVMYPVVHLPPHAFRITNPDDARGVVVRAFGNRQLLQKTEIAQLQPLAFPLVIGVEMRKKTVLERRAGVHRRTQTELLSERAGVDVAMSVAEIRDDHDAVVQFGARLRLPADACQQTFLLAGKSEELRCQCVVQLAHCYDRFILQTIVKIW